jgi:hypothetical protein
MSDLKGKDLLQDADLKLIKEVESFFRKLHGEQSSSTSLWMWSVRTPLLKRVERFLDESPELCDYITSGKRDKKSLLDLGCGFCLYWPLFQQWGFNNFVGIDLYTLRGAGDQGYQAAAQKICDHFCKDSEVRIIEGFASDAGDLFCSNWPKQNGKIKFDCVFTWGTSYTHKKHVAKGISAELFNEIAASRLVPDGFSIMIG